MTLMEENCGYVRKIPDDPGSHGDICVVHPLIVTDRYDSERRMTRYFHTLNGRLVGVYRQEEKQQIRSAAEATR